MADPFSFTIVRLHDPAIDYDAISREEWDAFLGDRDVARLRFTSGMSPAKFEARPLTLAERRAIRATPEHDRLERAFALGVVAISGYPHRVDSGDVRLFSWAHPELAPGKMHTVPDRVLEIISESDVQQIGLVVYERSFCPPDRPLSVPLLVTCRDGLRAAGVKYRLRRAAEKGSSSSGDDGSAPPKGTPASESADAGGAPTAATATASPTAASGGSTPSPST